MLRMKEKRVEVVVKRHSAAEVVAKMGWTCGPNRSTTFVKENRCPDVWLKDELTRRRIRRQ